MANEIEIVVKSTNRAKLDQLGKDGKAAGKELAKGIEEGADKAEQSVKGATAQMGKDLDKVGDKAKQAGQAVGDGVADGADRGSGKLGDALDSGIGKLAGVAAGGAAAIGGIFMAGLEQAMQADRVVADFVGDLGASEAQAGRLGEAAGNVYAEGFGESLEDAAAAIKAITRTDLVDMDAPVAELERLASAAMRTADIVEEDVGQVARAVSTMLRTGMAKSAEEGFDIVVRATQNGLNNSEDLLDTLSEYSTQFRKLGLDGPAALGLISQALEGGARDTDTAADAIKEFSLLAVDGSKETARAFGLLGLDAAKMSAAFAKGGPEAAAAFGLVLKSLRQLPDPLQRSQVAVGLFGTKAEDLGEALMHMDVGTAAAQFGEFAGAVNDANDALEKTNSQKLDEFGRKLSTGLGDALGALVSWTDESQSMHDDLKRRIEEEIEKRGLATDATRDQGGAISDATKAMHSQVGALDALIEKNNAFYDAALGARSAERDYQAALDEASESLKENGRTLDETTEKGRANGEALDNVATSAREFTGSLIENGATGREVAGVMEAARAEFVQLAIKMGMSAQEAEGLANNLGLIPGDYVAQVEANTAEASRRLENFRWLANDATKDRHFTVSWSSSGVPNTPRSYAHGGIIGAGHAAEGGPRSGMTLVGENGHPELLDLPPGTNVKSGPDTERILSGMSQGGGPIQLQLSFGGNTDSAFATAFMRLVREGEIQLTA